MINHMENKSFLFVNLSINCGYNSGINHGLAFLVPIVKKYGYKVSCLNLRDWISPQKFENKIRERNPSLVAFSTTSHQIKYLREYSESLKGEDTILQIAGGVGATLDPEGILSHSQVRGVCVGEGEIPLEQLLQNIAAGKDITTTEGFYWKMGEHIKKNRIPSFLPEPLKENFPD